MSEAVSGRRHYNLHSQQRSLRFSNAAAATDPKAISSSPHSYRSSLQSGGAVAIELGQLVLVEGSKEISWTDYQLCPSCRAQFSHGCRMLK